MVVLASGTGVAKIFGSLSIPVITRIYSPEHMGVLSVFVALTGMLVPFGTLRYSIALPLPKNDGSATNLVVLCMMSLCIMSSFSVLILYLFAQPILEMLSMQALVPYWWLLVITVIGAGLYEVLSQWAIREKAFKPVAKTQVWQSISGAAVKIGLGLVGLKPLGLLIGHIVTQVGGILSLATTFRHKFKANIRHVTKKRLLFMFKRYSDFPRYRLPSQFLLMFAIQAPLLFSAWLFGSETTGQLGLALMALALPMNLFGQSIGQAYYAEIAKIGRKNPRKIYILTKNITEKLFLVSIPPFLVLILVGPHVFSFVFGEQWREAGVFSRILALYLLTQFISTPLVNALSVFDKQGMFLRINMIRSIAIIMVFGLAYLCRLSPMYAILIYSIVLSVHYIFTSISVFSVIRNSLA
jgi:O-antigen/teichoic acid export membrane protein